MFSIHKGALICFTTVVTVTQQFTKQTNDVILGRNGTPSIHLCCCWPNWKWNWNSLPCVQAPVGRGLSCQQQRGSVQQHLRAGQLHRQAQEEAPSPGTPARRTDVRDGLQLLGRRAGRRRLWQVTETCIWEGGTSAQEGTGFDPLPQWL